MCKDPLKKEVVKIKQHTKNIRKVRLRTSKLDPYHDEIISLHREGVTVTEIMRWLKSAKNVVVDWGTVDNWLVKHG